MLVSVVLQILFAIIGGVITRSEKNRWNLSGEAVQDGFIFWVNLLLVLIVINVTGNMGSEKKRNAWSLSDNLV